MKHGLMLRATGLGAGQCLKGMAVNPALTEPVSKYRFTAAIALKDNTRHFIACQRFMRQYCAAIFPLELLQKLLFHFVQHSGSFSIAHEKTAVFSTKKALKERTVNGVKDAQCREPKQWKAPAMKQVFA
ncbi:hypothetical protein [Hydrogenophaga taeniospiralis]|uniref:hypothetical protein n=1 Tax=Hydrogenophaga taeniospiralis TaxID=65656 RepID=UPI001CF93931|nr:hypothetical protein [Hydrogenophaga taeniospiralis]UCU95238.1 hypothetical protein KI616_05090 [Hydrogenophaga taeniospiralis]